MTRLKLRPLTPRQVRFVAEYLIALDATQAARRAGYSQKTAGQLGYQLLQIPSVASEIAKGTARQLEKAELSAVMVLEAIRRQVVADVRRLFDAQGNLRPIAELSEEEAAMLAGFEIVTKSMTTGDKHQDRVAKVKLTDRSRYVDMAARHFKLLRDQVTIEGDWEKKAAFLASARARK